MILELKSIHEDPSSTDGQATMAFALMLEVEPICELLDKFENVDSH